MKTIVVSIIPWLGVRIPLEAPFSIIIHMPHIDTYKHLGPLQFELPMQDLAKAMCDQNYGVHRFLSALVYELRAKEKQHQERRKAAGREWTSYGASPLADGIERLLNDGLFY